MGLVQCWLAERSFFVMEMRGFEACDRILRYLRGGNSAIAVKQTGLLGELVEFAASLDQLLRRVEFSHSPLVQNYDPIRVNDRVDAVRNCDDSPIREDAAAQGALQQRIRLHVNCSLNPLLAETVIQK
jgi:hypothetical protein